MYEGIKRDRDNNMVCEKCGNIIMKHVKTKGLNSSSYIQTSERPLRIENHNGKDVMVVRCDHCGSDCVEGESK
jgi:hypothetical protein